MWNIPYEITEQILLRLPARSLLRFILVCKQWRLSISDPIFVKEHTKLALLDQSNNHVITRLITSEDDSSRRSMISQSIFYETLNSTVFEFKFKTQISRSSTLCSCNGLLLINNRVLWNPLLSNKYKCLPKSKGITTILHGFGYSASLDDYKVVRLNGLYNDDYKVVRPNGLYKEKKEAEVYSLKTNSWKVLPVDVLDLEYLCKSSRKGTHVEEYIYWIIQDHRWVPTLSNIMAIVCFNLITDNFKLIETPSGEEWFFDPLELVNVRGNLGLYGSTPDEVVIWIWNEDENMQGKWTKLLTIPKRYPRKKTRVLSFMNNDEILLHEMVDIYTNKLLIYNPVCLTFRDIPCGKDSRFARSMHHVVETLVSPISDVIDEDSVPAGLT